jgi:hypothetical protein
MLIDSLLKEDSTIYVPLANGDGKYECIPYSLAGSIMAFSHGEDLVNFMRKAFNDEKKCKAYCKYLNNGFFKKKK